MNVNKKPSKTGFFAALTGTVIVALCCATPILVIVLGAVGLSAFTPYLDYVLFPALFILLIILFTQRESPEELYFIVA